jgi:dihydrofolate reductase
VRPALALIAAVARNGVIGRDGGLPWRLPEDLRRFRALTTGHSIIMGRRTWDSIARPLPGRQSIVVTHQRDFAAEGASVTHSIEAALDAVRCPAPAFCIGGGELYRAALPLAVTAYITEVDRDFDGDATFPALDAAQWREMSRQRSSAGVDLRYAFVTYERVH